MAYKCPVCHEESDTIKECCGQETEEKCEKCKEPESKCTCDD